MTDINNNSQPFQGFLVTEFINDSGRLLTKAISYKNGKLEKSAEAKLNQGSFRAICFNSVFELARYIVENHGRHDKAIAYGVNHARKGLVAAGWKLNARSAKDRAKPGSIKRSNENFPYLIGQPGFMFKDLDGIPGMERADARDYDNIMCKVFPWLAQMQRFYIPSGSSHLWQNGVMISPKSGYHLVFGVSDASKIKALGDHMFRKLFDAGHGYQLVQTDGDCDPRTLTDRYVWQGSRLDFAFGAQLMDGVAQDIRGSMLMMDGECPVDPSQLGMVKPAAGVPVIDISAVRGALEMDEWKRTSAEYIATVHAVKDHAAATKAHYKGVAKSQIMASGISEPQAQAIVDAAFDGDQRLLRGEFILYGDDWKPFTVDQVLANPAAFDGKTFRPPLDPHYGAGKAKLFLGASQTDFPMIHAYWHGEKQYQLMQSARAAMGGALFTPGDNAPQVSVLSRPQPAPPRSHGLPPQPVRPSPPPPPPLSFNPAPVAQPLPLPLRPQPLPVATPEHWQPLEVAPPPVAAPTPLAELMDMAAPRFPLELLPPVLAAWVGNVAARRQCPPEMVAVPMLATLAGAIGHGAAIEIQDGWTERAAIWAMVISPKSNGKTESQNEVTFPLFALRAAALKEHKKALAAWADALTEGKATMATFKATMKKNPGGVADGDVVVPSLDEKPTWDPLILDSPTLEGLMRFQGSSRGLTLIKDELSGLISNMSRYNGGDDRPYYLEMYNGRPASFERANHDIHVDLAWLCVMGGIQPTKAKKLFSSENAEDDGMLERFQCMTYPARTASWDLIKLAVDRAARDAYEAVCRRLHGTPWSAFLHPAPFPDKPAVSRFSPEAQAVFEHWLTHHMRATKALEDGSPLLGFWGKTQGFCGRLALVLHLTKWAATPPGFQLDATTIDASTVTAAINLIEQFFKPTWERTLGAFSNKSKDHTVVKIASWIMSHPAVVRVTVRDVQRNNWAGLQDHDDVQKALTLLVDHGWLVERREVSIRGGRPTTGYDVVR